MENPILTSLVQRLKDHSATVAVLGLGYVGLPFAVVFAEAGFKVIGIDPIADKVARIQPRRKLRAGRARSKGQTPGGRGPLAGHHRFCRPG